MDAVKYLKEIYRMCDSMEECSNCPLNGCKLTFPCKGSKERAEYKDAEKCVAEVEKWSAEHPIKTRQSEFLKIFPNAILDYNGTVSMCPLYIEPYIKDDLCYKTFCDERRKKYWLAEVE